MYYLDATALRCPEILLAVKKQVQLLDHGSMLQIDAKDLSLEVDLAAWLAITGHRLITKQIGSGYGSFVIQVQVSQKHDDVFTDEIAQAAQALKKGQLVIFPTETVYGLGADALQEAAVQGVYAAKGRPIDHPLIVHVADFQQVKNIAHEAPLLEILAEHFWPGSLTVILKKKSIISTWVTAGQDTVAVRIPAHPVAQALLRAVESPVVAPSANVFGKLSPTRVEDIDSQLLDKVCVALDGGPAHKGIESTIIDLSGKTPRCLRPGAIAVADIEAVLQKSVSICYQDAIKVSGQHPAHYAPRTPLRVMAKEQLIAYLKECAVLQNIGVIAHSCTYVLNQAIPQQYVLPAHPVHYAQVLYTTLHALDQSGIQEIIVESPPEYPEWDAVRDRLMRAASTFILNQS